MEGPPKRPLPSVLPALFPLPAWADALPSASIAILAMFCTICCMKPSPSSRRLFGPALLAVLMLLLAGCKARADVGLDLNADGSGTFSFAVGFDEEFRRSVEESSAVPVDFTDPEDLAGLGLGFPDLDLLPADVAYVVSPYVDGGFVGASLSVPFEDLDGLRAWVEEAAPALPNLQAVADFGISRADGQFRFEASDGFLTSRPQLPAELEGRSDEFEVRFLLRMPGEVADHNATLVGEDGTLIWELGAETTGEPPFAVSEVSQMGPLALMMLTVALPVLLGVAATALLAALAWWVVNAASKGSAAPPSGSSSSGSGVSDSGS